MNTNSLDNLDPTGITEFNQKLTRDAPPLQQFEDFIKQVMLRLKLNTSDGRTYDIEVQLMLKIAVDPGQAEIGKLVHSDNIPHNQDKYKLTYPSGKTFVFVASPFWQRTE